MRKTPLLYVVLPLALLATSGCYGDVDSFIVGISKHGCKRLKECDKSLYEQEYDGDLKKCREETEDFWQDFYDDAVDADCEYVPEEGRECVKALKRNRTDCSEDADDDINGECEFTDVLDCPDDVFGDQSAPNASFYPPANDI